MSVSGHGRFAEREGSREQGGTIATPAPRSGTGPDPPNPRGPPLTIKIAQGDQILFESTLSEFLSQDLAQFLRLLQNFIAPLPQDSTAPPLRHSTTPSARFLLRKGLGTWHLI